MYYLYYTIDIYMYYMLCCLCCEYSTMYVKCMNFYMNAILNSFLVEFAQALVHFISNVCIIHMCIVSVWPNIPVRTSHTQTNTDAQSQ